jgi:hypothetical protein
MCAAIASMVPDHEFTLFTGDLVEGAEWQLTSEEIINTQFWMRVNFWVFVTGNGTDMV